MTTLLVGLVCAGTPRVAVLKALRDAQVSTEPCSLETALGRAPMFDAIVLDVGDAPETFVPLLKAIREEESTHSLPRLVLVDGGLLVSRVGALGDAVILDAAAECGPALAALVERASIANRLKALEEDASTLSHDARVLLGLVVGYAGNLRDGIVGTVTEAQHAHAVNIVDAATSTTALVDRHAAAMRTPRGEPLEDKPTIRRRLVDLAEVCSTTTALFQSIASAKRIGLESENTGAVPCWCDAMQIKQALVNLISNALKFTPLGGSVKVGARVVPESSTRRDVELFVADSGPGIPTHERSRVFERGVRLPRDGASAGSGIGLSVVWNVAALHGGSVHVEDSEPGGSTFVVVIPVDRRARTPELRLVPMPTPTPVRVE